MPKTHAEPWHADALQQQLHAKGLTHLNVRKHGAQLIVEDEAERIPCARLTRDTVHLWLLDVHAGRSWERTPFRATMDELVATLTETLGWILAPRE